MCLETIGNAFVREGKGQLTINQHAVTKRDVMIKCGDRITHLRERNGLTQEELANKLGISRSALSHYEKNRREPDYQILNDLADLFEVSIDYLFGRTESLQRLDM